MQFDRKQYISELADPTVNGMTIIELDEEGQKYRIAEKWQRKDGSRWETYWIEEAELLERIESDKAEPVGMLSDTQFEKVCQLSDERALEA